MALQQPPRISAVTVTAILLIAALSPFVVRAEEMLSVEQRREAFIPGVFAATNMPDLYDIKPQGGAPTTDALVSAASTAGAAETVDAASGKKSRDNMTPAMHHWASLRSKASKASKASKWRKAHPDVGSVPSTVLPKQNENKPKPRIIVDPIVTAVPTTGRGETIVDASAIAVFHNTLDNPPTTTETMPTEPVSHASTLAGTNTGAVNIDASAAPVNNQATAPSLPNNGPAPAPFPSSTPPSSSSPSPSPSNAPSPFSAETTASVTAPVSSPAFAPAIAPVSAPVPVTAPAPSPASNGTRSSAVDSSDVAYRMRTTTIGGQPDAVQASAGEQSSQEVQSSGGNTGEYNTGSAYTDDGSTAATTSGSVNASNTASASDMCPQHPLDQCAFAFAGYQEVIPTFHLSDKIIDGPISPPLIFARAQQVMRSP